MSSLSSCPDVYGLDVGLLIEGVKSFPELWDARCENYRNAIARNSAWNAICQFFDDEFEKKSEAAKRKFEKLVKSKWRHVRDNFIRSLKSSKAGKKYIFSQQLSFLLGSHSRYTARSKEISETCDGQPPQTSEEVESDHLQKRAWKRRKLSSPQRKEAEESVPSYLFLNASSSSRSAPEDEPKERSGTQLFFDSLLPLVETFTVDEELHFRIEVMRVIRSIKSSRRKPIKSRQTSHEQPSTQRHPDPARITVHVDPAMTLAADGEMDQQPIKREPFHRAGTSAEHPKPRSVYESSDSLWDEEDEIVEDI